MALCWLGTAVGLLIAGTSPAEAQADAAVPTSAAPSPEPGGGPNGGPGGAAGETVSPLPSPIIAPSGLLPATGSSVRLGEMSPGLLNDTGYAPPIEPAARAWTITPSLGVSEEYTDNVAALGGVGRGYDFVTMLQPGIAVSGNTIRLQGDISYNPELDIYARNSGQTRLDQNFGGTVKASLVPGTLFLDLRGLGQVTTNGLGGPGGGSGAGLGAGLGGLGSSLSTRNGATQTISLSATPYLVHRFGEWGTGELGASLQRTTESTVGGSSTLPLAPSGSPLSPFSPFAAAGDQTSTSYSEHAAFETGEAFGRYSGTGLLYATQTDGTGVLSGASRDTATLDNGYAVTRQLITLLRFGWERIRYGGLTPIRINDAIWDIGLRYFPRADSSIEIRYGHHDGFNSASLDMSIAPTARTLLKATYSEGLTTQSELLQTLLATADINALGVPVDHTTGIPLLAGDSFSGQQDNLTRTRQFDLTGVLVEDRDTFSIGVDLQDSHVVSSSGLPGALGSNQSLYGDLSWSHQISPTLTLFASGTYGVRETLGTPADCERVLYASASLSKQLSETVSARISYSYNRISSTPSTFGYQSNLVLVAISKSF